MSATAIELNGTGWGKNEDQAKYAQISAHRPDRNAAIHRDDGWIEFLALLRDWSAAPESIPLEEGDEPVHHDVAKRAFEHAFALYHDGKPAPTMVVPASDGAIVLERHITHADSGTTTFEHWSLRYTPDRMEFEVVKGAIPARTTNAE